MNKIIYLISFLISISVFGVDSKTQKIKHPGAADGLTRIDSNGMYIYDVEAALKNEAGHLRVGSSTNPEIVVDVQDRNGNVTAQIDFEDIYEGASKLTLGYDYEYFFSLTRGKWGGQIGFAAQYAQGQGRLKNDPTKSSIEKFTFVTLPLYLGGIYRFEYKDNQLFAPYIAAGGTYLALLEKRYDVSKINTTGAFGFYGTGGLLINLTAMDREMAADFDTEYGIGNLWINLEFKTVQVESDIFSYKSSFVQGGLSFDY